MSKFTAPIGFATGRLFLNIPYSEKTQAKSLGARWNPQAHKWYISGRKDYYKFLPWIADELCSPTITFFCNSMIIIEGQYECWRCHKPTTVIAFGAEKYFTLYRDDYLDQNSHLLPDATEQNECDWEFNSYLLVKAGILYSPNVPIGLSDAFYNFLKRYYHYSLDYDLPDQPQFLNHCQHCGAIQSHSCVSYSKNSPFFGLNLPERASKVTLQQIVLPHDVAVYASQHPKDSHEQRSSYNFLREYASWSPQKFYYDKLDEILIRNKDEPYIAPDLSPVTYPNLGIGNFVVLDTETTGLEFDDEVIELSILDELGKELYHSFFKPEKEIHPKAAKVSGITNGMLKSSPFFSSEWENIKRIIGPKRICGYNTEFDYRLVKQTLRRYGLRQSEADRLFSDYIDVLKFARRYVESPKYKLQTVSQVLGIKDEQKHRASDDCLMTLLVLRKIETLIGEKKTQATPQENFPSSSNPENSPVQSLQSLVPPLHASDKNMKKSLSPLEKLEHRFEIIVDCLSKNLTMEDMALRADCSVGTIEKAIILFCEADRLSYSDIKLVVSKLDKLSSQNILEPALNPA